MTTRRGSQIPVGSQFAPTLIDLPPFLSAIVQHSGDKEALQEAIFSAPVHFQRTNVPSSRRTASLPLEAAVQYELLTPREYRATDLARGLEGRLPDETYRRFAAHILLNLNGLRVLQGIEQMQADLEAGLSSEPVNGDSLARYLTANGLRVTEHNTAINSMRLWLAKASIFPNVRHGRNAWVINRSVLDDLLGIPGATLANIEQLDVFQRSFLLALCRVNPSGWLRASDLRDYAEATDEAGIRFNRGSLPSQVLEPLHAAGFIEWRSRGTTGGKSAELRTTSEFQSRPLAQFLERTSQGLDPVVTRYYHMRPNDIYESLDSVNTSEKGQALEAYAIHLMRLLGLKLVEWRKRARDSTGRAEVDALMAGVLGGIATTWQVQCKNTRTSVDLEDIAKEVGVVAITRATHILFATRSSFTRDAREFASRVTEESSLSLYLFDASDFSSIKDNAANLGPLLLKQSRRILEQRMSRPAWTRHTPAGRSITPGQ